MIAPAYSSPAAVAERSCRQCGATFTPRQPNYFYCSYACLQAHRAGEPATGALEALQGMEAELVEHTFGMLIGGVLTLGEIERIQRGDIRPLD